MRLKSAESEFCQYSGMEASCTAAHKCRTFPPGNTPAPACHHLSGFTIIEVLVAAGVIALLLALVVPAVQQVRESARRMQCSNNIRHLGLALAAYHDNANVFPPALIWGPAGGGTGFGLPPGSADLTVGGVPDRMYVNWLVLLLPYVEKQNLYDSWKLTLPISHNANRINRGTEIALFKCPSDPYTSVKCQLQNGNYARGNYAINFGPDAPCYMGVSGNTGCPPGVNGIYVAPNADPETAVVQVWASGVTGTNICFGFQDLVDGAANTILVDEIRAGLNPKDRRGTWAMPSVGASATYGHGPYGGHPGPNNCDANSDEVQDCNLFAGTIPRSECMSCEDLLLGQQPSVRATARSKHARGVHVVMADGSVRLIANNVNIPNVWVPLHTRGGAESEFDE